MFGVSFKNKETKMSQLWCMRNLIWYTIL